MDSIKAHLPQAGTLILVGDLASTQEMALQWIQQELCERRPQICTTEEPFGICPICRRLQQKTHESVLWVKPDKQQIRIEKAHEVLQFLSLKSLSSHRFVVIESAESLNLAAANALLKTLEEPPLGSYFFLLTPNASALLPTVRSRGLLRKAPPLPREKLYHDAEKSALQSSARKLFALVLQTEKLLTSTEWRLQLKDKSHWPVFLELWLEDLREALYIKGGQVSATTAAPIQELSSLSWIALQTLSAQVLEWQKELSIHRDSQLALEGFSAQHKSLMAGGSHVD